MVGWQPLICAASTRPLCLLRYPECRKKYPVSFLADGEAEDEVEFHGASSCWKMMVSKGWAGWRLQWKCWAWCLWKPWVSRSFHSWGRYRRGTWPWTARPDFSKGASDFQENHWILGHFGNHWRLIISLIILIKAMKMLNSQVQNFNPRVILPFLE